VALPARRSINLPGLFGGAFKMIDISIAEFKQILVAARMLDQGWPRLKQEDFTWLSWAFDDAGAHWIGLTGPRPWQPVASAEGVPLQ